MTIATITMPGYAAWNAFQQYRAALKHSHSEEDAALMRAYKAIWRGRKLIDLVAVMQEAGTDQLGRPKLAIQRADCELVWCDRDTDGSAEFRVFQDHRANRARHAVVRLPRLTFPTRTFTEGRVSCRARVPLIPPQYRPPGDLATFHLLWEAEWITVPRDPILLKHLGKNLYAVLATWELAPVEQAVLRMRTRE